MAGGSSHGTDEAEHQMVQLVEAILGLVLQPPELAVADHHAIARFEDPAVA